MELRTKIPLSTQKKQIDYNSKVLLLGSCFVENIGMKLNYFKFQSLQNPFGILFHPIAIEKLVIRALNDPESSVFTEEDIFFYNEQWHCFEVHSLVSDSKKESFLKLLNDNLLAFRKYILTASHIIFTYGTAWVYRFIETDSVVANCHKIPQKKFVKELLTIEKVSTSINNTISLIKLINPDAIIITTVSPVRHLKDGFIENTRSKAHLISGLQDVLESKKDTYYFPSYEIMMDELRDYRFYTEDMLHPNKTAISILWNKFSEVWISSKTKTLQKKIAIIQSGLQHKAFNPTSRAHKQFLQELKTKIKTIQEKFPNIKF